MAIATLSFYFFPMAKRRPFFVAVGLRRMIFIWYWVDLGIVRSIQDVEDFATWRAILALD
jgi:hypothetical protein